MKIAFIGCGKLGLPCAEEIVKAGHEVTGYDPAYIKDDRTFKKHNGLVDLKHTIPEAVKFAKIVFVPCSICGIISLVSDEVSVSVTFEVG